MRDPPKLSYFATALNSRSFIAAPTPIDGIGATFMGTPPFALLIRSKI